MRNHWMQIYKTREAKKHCVVALYFLGDDGRPKYIQEQAFADKLNFTLRQDTSIDGFAVLYKNTVVFVQAFHQHMRVPAGGTVSVDLSKLHFVIND